MQPVDRAEQVTWPELPLLPPVVGLSPDPPEDGDVAPPVPMVPPAPMLPPDPPNDVALAPPAPTSPPVPDAPPAAGSADDEPLEPHPSRLRTEKRRSADHDVR